EKENPNQYSRYKKIEQGRYVYDVSDIEIDIPALLPVESIDSFVKKIGMEPLYETPFYKGNLEVRVWATVRYNGLEAFILQRHNDIWRGYQILDEICPRIVEVEKPPSYWQNLWVEIENFGIDKLPDMDTFENNVIARDGISYFVELKRDNYYRAYHYSNPQLQKYGEAGTFEKIVKLLKSRFSTEHE
ncbi:MAG: hypothetical protein JXR91_17750, partial [Deltaproteobacteria bacterium]|nr:hypothetical protein [Deltaproteobacteria bacterium]